MELYATGFNAWGQLRFDDDDEQAAEDPDDRHAFTCVLRDEVIGRPRCFLSYTLVETSSGLRIAGVAPSEHERLRKLDSATYNSIVEASNERVVVLGTDATICQFTSIRDLLSGHQAERLHGVPALTQVVAYETGFAALSSEGQVWTWGDERYAACLGRDVTDRSPADKPGLVQELVDLPTGAIRKIAAGGYTLAALTQGNDLYVWGGHPGRNSIIDDLNGNPTPVVVEDNDVTDVAIGDAHMIVLTAGGEVFVIGEDSSGQLGQQTASNGTWMKVSLDLSGKRTVTGVAAGPRNSFILVQKAKD